MCRYVAWVWNDADANARQFVQQSHERLLSRGEQWEVGVSVPGLRVLHRAASTHATDLAYLLRDGAAGVALGVLFDRSQSPVPTHRVRDLDERESALIEESGGRRLVERYWGRYVAFVHSARRSTTWVVRDPTSAISCLTTRHAGVSVYWSSMEDALCLGLPAFSINWLYLIAAVCYLRLHVHQTGLAEVQQVLGGECVEHHAEDVARSFYWNAPEIATADPIEDLDAATNQLRAATRASVQGWASCYPHILLTLSGGLDSSIVLACLRDAPTHPTVTCLNYFSPGSNTDERTFARASAQYAGCTLIERPRDSDISLEPILQAMLTAAPVETQYWAESARTDAALAAERGAEAFFAGYGGDQLFFRSKVAWSAGDFLQRRGLGAGLLRAAMNAAQQDNRSLWSVLRETLSRPLHRNHDAVAEFLDFNRLLRREAVSAIRASKAFRHPWLSDPAKLPVGKYWHVLQVLIPPDVNPLAQQDDPDRIAPLYSQPLMETCLRIPSYLLTHGDCDRPLARRAFSGSVAPEILRRRTKGGAEEHLKSILKHNASFVRALLMDGELVKQNILDRKALTGALSSSGTGMPTWPMEMFEYINTEAWLQRWRMTKIIPDSDVRSLDLKTSAA